MYNCFKLFPLNNFLMAVRNSYFSCPEIVKYQPPKSGTNQQHHHHYHSKYNNLPIIMMNYTISTKGGEINRKDGQYKYSLITLCGPREVKSKMVNQQ